MQVERICARCGEVNNIDSSNLVRQDVCSEDGEYFKVMYCKCKRCKEINVVQIDNMETLELFRKLKALIIKVARKQMKRETVSPKEVKKKDKLTKELREKRKEIEDLMQGRKLFDENREIFVNSLTFPKVGDIIDSNL